MYKTKYYKQIGSKSQIVALYKDMESGIYISTMGRISWKKALTTLRQLTQDPEYIEINKETASVVINEWKVR